nr:hypothetical protein [Tanacetum cinerariifolium]
MIPNAIWDAITELCTFFRVLCSKELHIEDLETLKDIIVVTLCKLEKVFPPGLFDSMEHLVIHLVNKAINGGPEQYRWMYLYERKLGSLKRKIKNRARPEGSIVRPIAQTHPNIEEHKLDQFRERDFASWFADHILSGSDPRNEHLKDLAYGPINEVTSHKGYIVNGYKFHTLAHGGGRVTNNTGVCVKGSCYNEEESDYYEELEEVIEDLKDWWAVVKAMPRGIFQVAEGILATEISNDDNVNGEEFFQENDRLVCTIGTTEDIQQVTLVREEIEKVQTALVTDDTNDNGKEEEFEDMNGDDDSSDDIDLDSSNHSSDDDAGQARGSHPKSSTSRSIPTGRGGSSIVGRGREIENEWSPRGRGNNSSNGNGRDIPDEYSQIRRGSNNTYGNGRGKADDCSPRERGSNTTSGNGRGITDDISPRGRGRTNRDISDDCSPIGRASSSIGGRSNESADEWCLGPNILGDEILDAHEDNEEHVEHVVGSSQIQVRSKVTSSSSLLKLWLVGGVLFKTMFKGAYATWTKVPQDHCNRCFKRFGTFYRWEDVESNQICDAWESHMKNRYSDIIRGVRKAAMKVTRVNDNVDIGRISFNLPIWIGVADWQPMVNDEYSKIISEKNKENEENTEIDENGSKSPPDDFEV